MTATQKFILIAVFIAVVCALSAAVRQRTASNEINTKNPWVTNLHAKLAASQKVDFKRDLDPKPNASGEIAVPSVLEIKDISEPDRFLKFQRIRKLKITGMVGGTVKYQPRPDTNDTTNPPQPLDKPAIAFNFTFQSTPPTFDLVILPHGGRLALSPPPGPAVPQVVFKLE